MAVILIADDHPLFRAALRQAAQGLGEDARILEAEDLDGVLSQLQVDGSVDLVLLDLRMPGNHGLAGLAAIRAQFPQVAVAVCSGHDDPSIVRRALDHGAAGFIPKRTDMATMRHAIDAILACEVWLPADLRGALEGSRPDPADHALALRLASLTPQQFRVLALVAEGLLNKQIADRLDVQERTVKAHITAIFEKLGVRNRTQASLLLRELSLNEPAVGESGRDGG
ncbi:MAG TPA: response regulator transcription factor [Chiayiivirga sp.]|nr:response regulator transcription factor [Chiayiivirga sp.]